MKCLIYKIASVINHSRFFALVGYTDIHAKSRVTQQLVTVWRM